MISRRVAANVRVREARDLRNAMALEIQREMDSDLERGSGTSTSNGCCYVRRVCFKWGEPFFFFWWKENDLKEEQERPDRRLPRFSPVTGWVRLPPCSTYLIVPRKYYELDLIENMAVRMEPKVLNFYVIHRSTKAREKTMKFLGGFFLRKIL